MITLNVNGKPLDLDIPEDLLMTVVRTVLATAHTGSNDIDADIRAHVNALHAKSQARSVPWRPLGGLAPGALRRVREYIDQHLAESIVTDALARIAGLSTGHFARAFKQSTGDSPHHYITRQRVAMAKELLVQTNRALAQIALEVGFADQSHFNRTYVAIAGETPGAYRRRHR